MTLTPEEQTYVRSQGLYLTAKCDACEAILNQSVRYTIAGKPEVYCSVNCRDRVFFEDQLERKKRSTPGHCVNCKGSLQGKKRMPFTAVNHAENGIPGETGPSLPDGSKDRGHQTYQINNLQTRKSPFRPRAALLFWSGPEYCFGKGQENPREPENLWV